MKIKKSADFTICISVPLIVNLYLPKRGGEEKGDMVKLGMSKCLLKTVQPAKVKSFSMVIFDLNTGCST